MGSAAVSRKSSRTRPQAKPARERVLIEFPAGALRQADEAARAQGVSRSEFIRTAVEQRLQTIAEAEFERELAEACIANNARNLELLKEFEHVDRDAWKAIP